MKQAKLDKRLRNHIEGQLGQYEKNIQSSQSNSKTF